MENRNIEVIDLVNVGFEDITNQKEKTFWESQGIKEYSEWQLWTPEGDALIVMAHGVTNNGALWGVHIDNSDCDSIGYADISTVRQFNLIMEALDIKFRLK